jgi:hypothetical protein
LYTALAVADPEWRGPLNPSWYATVASPCTGKEGRQCDLFRDIIGNPFRTVAVEPIWLNWQSGVVAGLAEATYQARHRPSGLLDNDRLAVLADALEEAGCTDAEILYHLRKGGEHVRGCWVVDLLLNKK